MLFFLTKLLIGCSIDTISENAEYELQRKWCCPRYNCKPWDGSGSCKLSAKLAVENGTDTCLPTETNIQWNRSEHSSEEVLMGEMEQRVVAPASHSVILEVSVEYAKGCCLPKQHAHPKEQHAPPSCPQSIVISHVRLECAEVGVRAPTQEINSIANIRSWSGWVIRWSCYAGKVYWRRHLVHKPIE